MRPIYYLLLVLTLASCEVDVTFGSKTTTYNRTVEVTPTSTVSTDTVQSGLIAYYPFNGNANDETVNKNHGVPNGATLTTDRNGKPNSAYYFMKSEKALIKLNNIMPINNLKKVSIVCWAKKDFKNDDGVIFGSWYSGPDGDMKGSSTGPIGLYCTLTSINDVSVSVKGGDQITTYREPISFPTEWNMYTVVFDGSNPVKTERLKIYVNNIQKWLPEDSFDKVPETIGESSNLALIGARGSNTGTFINAYFNGCIDDVRVYDKALTTKEVEYIYKH
jgi:hypothetical protein